MKWLSKDQVTLFKDFLAAELPLVSKSDPRIITDMLLLLLDDLDHTDTQSMIDAIDREVFEFISSARDRIDFSNKLINKLSSIKKGSNTLYSSNELRDRRSRSRSRERDQSREVQGNKYRSSDILSSSSSSSSSHYHEQHVYHHPPISSFAPPPPSSSSSSSSSSSFPNIQQQHHFQAPPPPFLGQQQNQSMQQSYPFSSQQFVSQQQFQQPVQNNRGIESGQYQSWQQSSSPSMWQPSPPPTSSSSSSSFSSSFSGIGIGGPPIAQQTTTSTFQRSTPNIQSSQPRALKTLCVQNCHGMASDKNALLNYFSNFGTITNVDLKGDPPRQTAFISFTDASACDLAVASKGLVCGESNVRLMYANYDANIKSHNTLSNNNNNNNNNNATTTSSGNGNIGGSEGDEISKERILYQQQQQQHQLALQIQRQQEKLEREKAAIEAVEKAKAIAAAEVAIKRETSVDKAHRVIQAKAKEADDLQIAILAQKDLMNRFKESKATMSSEEKAAMLAMIHAQQSKIKEQQGKLTAAVTTAKMAVDSTKKGNTRSEATTKTATAATTTAAVAATTTTTTVSGLKSNQVTSTQSNHTSSGLVISQNGNQVIHSEISEKDTNNNNGIIDGVNNNDDEEEESSFVIEE
jgi:hypothetical protein